MKYEAVIGLEIHAQLSTSSKMFCSCSTFFGQKPNSNICPVCTSQPGSLPVLNAKAVDFGLRTALALNCSINKRSVFARKNYFYPDLPKGYQISQYEEPLAVNGWVEIDLKDGKTKKIGITRVHMEEDAGKNIHNDKSSFVDLNRAGVPLLEIVSEPDIRSAEEASAYFKKLRTILSYIEVSNCNMEEGNLRCDVNVSVRKRVEDKFGTKVEIKNVNSFKFVEKTILYEVQRQSELLDKEDKIIQETRSFDPSTGLTKSMRKKEEANDYRYFPEPDLRPLDLSDDFINQVKEALPELPDLKKTRFIKDYGLSPYDAAVLSSDREVSSYYEKLAAYTSNPKISSNWMQTEVLRVLNENKCSILDFELDYKKLGDLIKFVLDGTINQTTAKKILEEMLFTKQEAAQIIQKKGLAQISDSSEVEKIVDEILVEFSQQVEQYKNGKQNVAGFLVGQVMKKSKGKANPVLVNKILRDKIK
jgi:aspartyl-tRNA(Asn)/glutamyl-tRNA(Gln) amidotransferase subunit B